MKNTFKQKKNFLKNSYVIGTVSILLFLSFIFGFVYNQNRVILAEEEEEEVEYEKLKCGREIPVGEAMEKTGELLEEIMKELEKIEKNSYDIIKDQEEMEELAEKCSMDNCTPKCEAVTIKDGTIACISKPCQGDVCPEKEKIEELFAEITRLNEEIQGAKDKIYKLIYENVEPLCAKENEDIRTDVEKAQCWFSVFNVPCWDWTREEILPWLPDKLADFLDTCPAITVQEAIARKLNLSRGEFDKCYLSPEDIEKVFLGEETGKYLFNCQRVEKEDYPRYTKTEIEIEGKKIPVCTSPYNWFCCLDVP